MAENKDHIFCEDLPADEEIPDFPAIHYVRGNTHPLFPPASRDASFDPISVSSTIIRLSELDNTTFEDLGNWLDGIIAFQGVICPLGEAFIEVIQPSDVIILVKGKRAVRGC